MRTKCESKCDQKKRLPDKGESGRVRLARIKTEDP
ncbi:hypothetical protein Dhaf_4523 [Desulfitobacterium hafniense DCB-2]|uniref:Uncharacterized protein n=1 Tax=Desulfitobacterium hafniense (strain DSM 10664 / DCB-2) TaxID=272564 RepID=B8FWM6_DESHD|nr:hypothetical protein Dhaf_4523 [Desulfitobacterium hafniense DCB-2]